MKKFFVKIYNSKKQFEVSDQENLFQALISNGVNLYVGCGGQGVCGKCKVKIRNGVFETQKSVFLAEKEIKNNIVLSCLTKLRSDAEIEILDEANQNYIKSVEDDAVDLLGIYGQDIKSLLKEKNLDYETILKVVECKLPIPTIENAVSDLTRLVDFLSAEGFKNIFVSDLSVIKKLPKKLRDNEFCVSVILSEDFDAFELVDIMEVGEKDIYGLAIDIGTTTIEISLIDLINGTIIATKVVLNKQMVYGEDVLTRIIFAETPDGLEKLHQKVVISINEIIDNFVKEKNIFFHDIYVAVVAANTTMTHLFYSIDPKNIRREPYVPAAVELPKVRAKELNVLINPEGIIYSVPGVASYVGGDIIAGIVAVGMDEIEKGFCALIDLGTNGEIVVGNKDYLVCAACSAGPAFEGVGIKSGMRAVLGAVEDIEIKNEDIILKVIGGGKPKGICGSGLISIPSELFRCGLIDRSGKFVKNLGHGLKNRIRLNENGDNEFVLCYGSESLSGEDLTITESDIANILRSKGAIFHGLYSLIKYLNLEFSNIEKVFISGGFGNFLNIEKAQLLGLLPDLPLEKFIVSGNTSLLGAQYFLTSRKIRQRIKDIKSKITYIELSTLPVYMNNYSSCIFIPHTDLSLFPNIVSNLKGKKDFIV